MIPYSEDWPFALVVLEGAACFAILVGIGIRIWLRNRQIRELEDHERMIRRSIADTFIASCPEAIYDDENEEQMRERNAAGAKLRRVIDEWQDSKPPEDYRELKQAADRWLAGESGKKS
ncbi:MAG: hypothetical protein ACREQF_07990 [Candidatus Binataceae bacterium]